MYCISSNRRPGIYFLRNSADPVFKRAWHFKWGQCLFSSRISCPRPPTLHSARRDWNSLQFVRLYGKPRERRAHSIAFNLKDTSKYLFCAIGVAVSEVQLSPSSLLCGARGLHATPPSWYRPTWHLIETRRLFAILPLIPPAFIRGRCLFKAIWYIVARPFLLCWLLCSM